MGTLSLRSAAAATLIGLATLTTSFTTSAAPPEKGSEQWNMMAPFGDFIKQMRTRPTPNNPYGGSCCDLSDGRGDMRERFIKDAANPHGGYYEVFVTRQAYGAGYENFIPPEGRWVRVPDHAVLTAEHAQRVCEDVIKRNPTGHSCNMPPFNILWMNSAGHVYCYWPIPNFTEFKPTEDRVKFAGIAPR